LNTLADRLARRIRTGGPITVAEYMASALSDPRHGYYRTASPIGTEGDFTTAPEISQMFGELIAAWLVECWMQMGRPLPVRLIELGPGRGTLMSDILRVAARLADWGASAEIHLVEINPALRRCQALALAAYRTVWHDSLATVPGGPALLIANEFFDALPIRQLVFHAGAWRERRIGWSEDLGFHFVVDALPTPLAALLPAAVKTAQAGEILEISPASVGLMTEIAERCRDDRGAALIVDYGRAETGCGESLQAVRRHRSADILVDPGTADLSALVDFARLAQAAREAGAAAFGPATQGDFLRALGIEARARRLEASASSDQRRDIEHAVERLTGKAAMGNLFKVLAVAAPEIVPGGFVHSST
jgi:NADH dehydrogenase [ubiquinone] 1 alpha subcomplex assembly factor 7